MGGDSYLYARYIDKIDRWIGGKPIRGSPIAGLMCQDFSQSEDRKPSLRLSAGQGGTPRALYVSQRTTFQWPRDNDVVYVIRDTLPTLIWKDKEGYSPMVINTLYYI